MTSSPLRLCSSPLVRALAVAALVGCNPPATPPDACTSCGSDGGIDGGVSDTGTDTGPLVVDTGVDAFTPPVDANADTNSFADGGLASDPNFGARQACAFARFADSDDTVGTPAQLTAARGAIQHVFVIMQENRSFDHFFGVNSHGWDGFPAGFTNPDGSGGTVAPFHAPNFCQSGHPPHQWTDIHNEWHDGAMDGFVTAGTMTAMSYYTESDHPFYTWMLSTFATSDRYFADVLSGTWPNRDYLYAGTSNGVMSTGMTGGPTVTVFDRLDAAGITWGDYNASPVECLEGALGLITGPFCTRPSVHPYADLAGVLAAGTAVPAVVFVDLETMDEHPDNGDVRVGENAVHDVMQQIFASSVWAHSAVFFTYDEGGGFVDHVPPPSACPASAAQAALGFDRLGIRVPVAVVSPYSRPGYNSELTHSHASILRFIETIFDLQALSGRDANADAMLDMFDFSSAHFATVPAASVTAAMPAPATCP